ncbi:hypothetical protein PsorP6_002181 [Peronosclerospora sorghi]|uniref:Uncharacterized protein n=1 Tax=Peronosclerospora sorghi TaxID=230839 RepID=A0ACC0WSF4_9STRA|nr:hypothetical protein PsorP6_002181 [Peronosclerospora sorghi]
MDPAVVSCLLHQCEDEDEYRELAKGLDLARQHLYIIPVTDNETLDGNSSHWSLLLYCDGTPRLECNLAALNRLDLEKCGVGSAQRTGGGNSTRTTSCEKRLQEERVEKIRKWKERKAEMIKREQDRVLAREEEISNMTPLERVDGLGSLDDDTARMLEKRKLRLQRRHAPTTGRVNKAAYRRRMEEAAGGKTEVSSTTGSDRLRRTAARLTANAFAIEGSRTREWVLCVIGVWSRPGFEVVVDAIESRRLLMREARDEPFDLSPVKTNEDRDAIEFSSPSDAKESNDALRKLLLDFESRDSLSLELWGSKGSGGGGILLFDDLDDFGSRELRVDQTDGAGGGGGKPALPSYLDPPAAGEIDESREEIDELFDKSLPEDPGFIGMGLSPTPPTSKTIHNDISTLDHYQIKPRKRNAHIAQEWLHIVCRQCRKIDSNSQINGKPRDRKRDSQLSAEGKEILKKALSCNSMQDAKANANSGRGDSLMIVAVTMARKLGSLVVAGINVKQGTAPLPL